MSVRLLVLSAALLLLAACNRNPLEVVISRCPAVAVVGDAATLSTFKAGTSTRFQDDLAFTASIAEVEVECENDSRVEAVVDFAVIARAYDGAGNEALTLPYFVAVLKDNSQLITKQTYTVSLSFDENGLAKVPQRVLAEIPTIEQARDHTYEVLIGFSADADTVYYNWIR